VIATDTPERIRANAAVQEAYLGSAMAATMLEVRDLHAYYGKSHILHGVDLRVGEGEIVSCWGATASAARPPSRPSWARSPHGVGQFKGREIGLQAAPGGARTGLGYVPENRDIFPS
jgi:branched-chain amino acid transport system ATP-binding protein